MTQIETILQLMKPELNGKQQKTLAYVLEVVLQPSHCDKTDKDVLQAFAEHQRFANESEGSIKQYGYTLKALSKFSEYNIVNYDHTIIKAYLEECRKKCSARTIAHKLTMISSFYNYLVLEDWIAVNPCNKIPKIKIPKTHKEGINDIDLEKVIKSLTNDRDRAILEFMRSTGCRISEIVNLNVGDINFKNHTAFIRQAKGKKDRIVSFDSRCEKSLKKYFKPLGDRDKNDPVFLRRSRNTKSDKLYENTRITYTGIKTIMKEIKKNSNVETFHAHAVRHNCITKLLNNNMPAKLVSLQAGHASVATTLDIYDDVTLHDMQREYQRAMEKEES